MNKITVRYATENDYLQIKGLMIQSRQHHIDLRPDSYRISDDFFSKDMYNQLLKERKILAAVCNEKIVGSLSYSISVVESSLRIGYKCMWISDIVTDENYRRQGIANILFEKAKEIAYENSADRIELSVDSQNKNAIDMYKKLGFSESVIKMELPLKNV